MSGACFYNWQSGYHPCQREINKQIRDLNYELLGAGPPPLPEHEDITCPGCASVLRVHYKVETEAPAPGTLKCSICGRDLGRPLEAVEYLEIISSPVIDQLLADIAGLDAKIAEVRAKISNVRAEIARHRQILGL